MGFSKRNQKGNGFKIVFCLLANFVCFGFCYYIGLPMRLEHVGSMYVAAAFGVGPAVFIAVVSALVYSLFYFRFSYMLMLIPVILVLFLISTAVKYGWLDTVVSSFGTMVFAILVMLIFTWLISLMIGNSFMAETCWADIYDTLARYARFNKAKLLFVTACPFVTFNVFLSWCISMLVFRLSPKQVTYGFSKI